MKYTKAKIILFILLAVVSVVGHTCFKRYKIIGDEILTKSWSLRSAENTRAEIQGNTFFLFSANPNRNAEIEQEVPSFVRGTILQLSADLKCENVIPGNEKWNRARLILMQYNNQGTGLNLPHHVVSFIGSREWGRHTNYFTIAPETKKILVSAQLSNCTGSFWLKNITLYPVVQKRIYTYLKTGILSAWAIFAIFFLSTFFVYKKSNLIIRAIFFLSFIAIILGTTMSHDSKTRISDLGNDIVLEFTSVNEVGQSWDLFKVGHFCFFLCFGLGLSLLLIDESDSIVILNILLLAGATELVQLYIDGRTLLFRDVMIDLNGGLFGFIIAKLVCVIANCVNCNK